MSNSGAEPRNLYRLVLDRDELRALYALAVAGAEGLSLGAALTPEERQRRALRAAGEALTRLVGISPSVHEHLFRQLEALAAHAEGAAPR